MISDIYKKDTTLLLEYLKEINIPEPFIGTNEKNILKLHRFIYSLALFEKELSKRKLKSNKIIFLKEIKSDSLQSLYSFFLGQKKVSRLLLRSLIENLFKTIYFSEHKIEYIWLMNDNKYYINIDLYKDFSKKHPSIIKSKIAINFIHVLRDDYRNLSIYVHSKSYDYMELTKCLKSISFKEDDFEEYFSLFNSIMEKTMFILILFYFKYFKKFHSVYQDFIIESLAPRLRKEIRKFDV